jgi:hypothetical protein
MVFIWLFSKFIFKKCQFLALMAFTFVNPYVPMVLMGISYSSLAASLWFVVEKLIIQV